MGLLKARRTSLFADAHATWCHFTDAFRCQAGPLFPVKKETMSSNRLPPFPGFSLGVQRSMGHEKMGTTETLEASPGKWKVDVAATPRHPSVMPVSL